MLAATSSSSARAAATKAPSTAVDGRRLMVACVRHQQMRRLAAAAAVGAAAAAAAAAADDAPSPSSSSRTAMPTPQELRAQLRGGGFACMAAVAAAGNTQAEIYFGLAKAIDVSWAVVDLWVQIARPRLSAAPPPTPAARRARARKKQQGRRHSTTLPLSSQNTTPTTQKTQIYLVVLTGRVLLSWFRNLDWSSEPLNSLSQLTDPFLNCFRGLVPAIAGIDLSPMLGFFGLQFIRGALVSMASA
jgi:YggT family protein